MASQWRRKRHALGRMTLARHAGDIVAGFEKAYGARRFQTALRRRMEHFSLSLHPETTRLIEYGRFAALDRARGGLGKPETFNFPGFTHIRGRSQQGGFQFIRKSRRERVRTRLREIKDELRRRMHHSIPQQGQWLR